MGFLARQSYEFPTEEALKKYLQEHPKANKSLHHVAPRTQKPLPKVVPPQVEESKTPAKKFTPTKADREDEKEISELFTSYDAKTKEWSNTPYQEKVDKSLSDLQKTYIKKYTGDYYVEFNMALRSTNERQYRSNLEGSYSFDYSAAKFMASTLTKGLKKQKLPESIKVKRGFGLQPHLKDLFEKALSGEIDPTDIEWSDKGFSSTSIRKETALRFASDVLCNITLPKGSPGMYVRNFSINANEDEFLLPPKSKFRMTAIRDKTQYSDYYEVDCELVLE